MTDRDHAGRSDEKRDSTLLTPSDCCCGNSSPSRQLDNKNHLVWRRYCTLALVLSALSVLLCAVIWSQNASAHRRLLLVEQRLKTSLTIDDPQLDAKLQALLDSKLVHLPTSADVGSSPARNRITRQVGSAPADCLCPPGNSSPPSSLMDSHFFSYLYFLLHLCFFLNNRHFSVFTKHFEVNISDTAFKGKTTKIFLYALLCGAIMYAPPPPNVFLPYTSIVIDSYPVIKV